ncbi:hypothetical protein MCOR25_010865 [Pyricularia grisea]|nr:hypothetical protein MCOR25_010865 [Pyricularia grisea]
MGLSKIAYLILAWSSSLLSVAGEPCTNPSQRRAWHTLSDAEKKAYIDAELCLMAKPTVLGLNGTRTLFDELQAIHQLQAWATHSVAAFLPFHRVMMHVHEFALREDCGYTGYQPYWYEQLDAGKFISSVVLDPVTGFGGNGAGTNGCIVDGPFANYTNSLGPGYDVTDHCINRAINETASTFSSQQNVDECLSKTTWKEAWACIESVPHTGGHGGVGGEMSNGVSSPGDPVFYLHHTWLDKVYWDWQARDRPARTSSISGNNVMRDDVPGFPPKPAYIPEQNGAPGDPGNETTLGHIIQTFGKLPNVTIADVLDIQGNYLCYEYVEP